jgi:hypothetical protein
MKVILKLTIAGMVAYGILVGAMSQNKTLAGLPAPTPEPISLAMFGAGTFLIALGHCRRRSVRVRANG